MVAAGAPINQSNSEKQFALGPIQEDDVFLSAPSITQMHHASSSAFHVHSAAGQNQANVSIFHPQHDATKQGNGVYRSGTFENQSNAPNFHRASADSMDKQTDHAVVAYQSDNIVTPSRHVSSSIGAANRHHIGGVDVQGIYPPDACIFVANLPEAEDDQALEAAVTKEFLKYGTVFVKIRRDPNGMPFAFCQYTRPIDAKIAVENGRGASIIGRACRTEMVKSNREFFLVKRQRGAEITVQEAHHLLRYYADLDVGGLVNDHQKQAYGLDQDAVRVTFKTFDASRDALKALKNHPDYRLEPTKDKAVRRGGQSDVDFLAQYDEDRRSVYIGNLNPAVTRDEIWRLMENIGDIADVTVKKKGVHDRDSFCFAFVVFARADAPDAAVSRFHGTTIKGHTIRVERKIGANSKSLITPRRSLFGPSPRRLTKEELGGPPQDLRSPTQVHPPQTFATPVRPNTGGSQHGFAINNAMTPLVPPAPMAYMQQYSLPGHPMASHPMLAMPGMGMPGFGMAGMGLSGVTSQMASYPGAPMPMPGNHPMAHGGYGNAYAYPLFHVGQSVNDVQRDDQAAPTSSTPIKKEDGDEAKTS